MFNMISKTEWKQVLLLIAFALVILMAPTVYGWLLENDQYRYTGLHMLTPIDYPVYYSYINQVKEGHLVFIDLFTPEPQSRIMINPFWLAVGLMARVFDLSAPVALHAARFVLIPAAVVIIYLFLSHLIDMPRRRLWATVFTMSVSGMGMWLTPMIQEPPDIEWGRHTSPSDMWVAEGNTFLTLLHSPHMTASLIAMLSIIMLWWRAIATRQLRWTIGGGVLALVWFWFHPFHILTMGALMGAYCLLLYIQRHPDREQAVWSAVHIWLMALPALLYYSLMLNLDWLTVIKTYQNINLSPVWWLMVIGFGGMLPLAFIGWIHEFNTFRKKKNINPSLSHHARCFALIWLPIHWLMIYVPVNYQRRMMLGLPIVTALFAWHGLVWLWEHRTTLIPNTRRRARALALAISIGGLVLFFTTFGNWLTEFDILTKRLPHLYLRADQAAAFTWLQENTSPDDIILSHRFLATLIPAYTSRRVYTGHGVESAYEHCCKLLQTAIFFQTYAADNKKEKLLRDNNISYVALEPSMFPKKYISPINLDTAPFLKTVFTSDSVTIYAVKPINQ